MLQFMLCDRLWLFQEILNDNANKMMSHMINPLDPTFRRFLQNASPDTLRNQLNAAASAMGDEAFTQRVATEIVAATRPEQAVPEKYAHYRSVVRDGMLFFLSQVDRHRLIDLVVSQLQMDPDADTRERLLELAKRFPTLHKLGQTIARNPQIDPLVKQWLVHLENGCYGTPAGGILDRIHRELNLTGNPDPVHVQATLLSEASVGAVVPFRWDGSPSRQSVQGVFKVLKPGIRRSLDEELVVLAKTAAFFEANRKRYPLEDFRFIDVFEEVREMLVNEIDLTSEQTYLVEAARFYGSMDRVQIPGLLPFSTDRMTAMAFLDGAKITDADLDDEERLQLATVLFEALVCRPLFSGQDQSLFHGDPHAGNILAVRDPETGQVSAGLLDWSLAGRLTKQDRVKTAQLIQAVLKKDLSGIRRSIKALAVCKFMESAKRREAFRDRVLHVLQSAEYDRMTLLERSFRLLEALALQGFVFPPDLMLFRKAIFTLEGVLNDLWPAFDMDAAITQYLATLVTREIPKRFVNLFFPLADRPGNYPSLISNIELHSLMVHQYLTAVNTTTRSVLDTLSAWPRMFGMPALPALAPIPLPEAPQSTGLRTSRSTPAPSRLS